MTSADQYTLAAAHLQLLRVEPTFSPQGFEVFTALRYDPLLPGVAPDWTPPQVVRPRADPEGTSGVDSSKVFLYNEHVRRINFSLAYFGWKFELLPQLLVDKVHEAVMALEPAARLLPYKMRVFINPDGEVRLELFEVAPVQLLTAGLDAQPSVVWPVVVAKNPVDILPFTLLKTTKRDHYNKAREENLQGDGTQQEVLIYNSNGMVFEASICNVCHGKPAADGSVARWVTPPLSSGGVCGTTRNWALKQGWIEEGPLQVQDVAVGDQILLMNSVIGLVRGEVTRV